MDGEAGCFMTILVVAILTTLLVCGAYHVVTYRQLQVECGMARYDEKTGEFVEKGK